MNSLIRIITHHNIGSVINAFYAMIQTKSKNTEECCRGTTSAWLISPKPYGC